MNQHKVGVVKFGNPGRLDPNMWYTFGVSVKENPGAIGEFGTGLKYAIAVCLREGRAVRIDSGGHSYHFDTISVEFRGQTYDVVRCNKQRLPFTTHLGHKWELWQAYRELCSNCYDEGGSVGVGDETTVYAELGDIRHEDVFLNTEGKRLVEQSERVSIYSGESHYLYYRGIRVLELQPASMFTYDLQKVTPHRRSYPESCAPGRRSYRQHHDA